MMTATQDSSSCAARLRQSFREGSFMAEAKTCANPACTCPSRDQEKFCSKHCEGTEHAVQNAVEMICQCGHLGCGRAALDI
jgi:hypothetical protein